MTALIPTLYLTTYAIFHSLLAAQWIKDWVCALSPVLQKTYRLFYTILSLLLLIPLPFLPWPSGVFYSISPPGSYLLHLVQILSIIGFIWSLSVISLGEFLGFARAQKTPAMALQTRGPYRLCRHPLYFFASLFMLAHPHMTHTWALLSTWAILYFWIGTYFEERRLVDEFGESYHLYQQNRPRMIPNPFLPH